MVTGWRDRHRGQIPERFLPLERNPMPVSTPSPLLTPRASDLLSAPEDVRVVEIPRTWDPRLGGPLHLASFRKHNGPGVCVPACRSLRRCFVHSKGHFGMCRVLFVPPSDTREPCPLCDSLGRCYWEHSWAAFAWGCAQGSPGRTPRVGVGIAGRVYAGCFEELPDCFPKLWQEPFYLPMATMRVPTSAHPPNSVVVSHLWDLPGCGEVLVPRPLGALALGGSCQCPHSSFRLC